MSKQYTFHNVWKEKNQDLLDEIVSAWLKTGALNDKKAAYDRAKQVVLIVRGQDDEIVAITTAFNRFIKRFKNSFFIYRCLIFPGHRIPGLMHKITRETIDFLEEIKDDFEENIVGVLSEFENKGLQKLDQAVLSSGFVFIGFTERGFPLRAYYFKDSKINL